MAIQGGRAEQPGRKTALKNGLVTIGTLAAATGLCLILDKIDDMEHADAYVSMVFVLAVFLIARTTSGYFYGVLASLIGVLAVNYFFTFPYFAFNFSLPGYPITVTCMLAVSILTSTLTSQIKRQRMVYVEAEREKMRGNLLRAVSHDLRTPLTSILGANSVLMENDGVLTREQRMQMHREINEDAQWLIRMVENLLAITRIDSDRAAKIVKTNEAVEEVVAEAVNRFHKRFADIRVEVRVPEELLMCPMDAILIEQVLVNLLENAALHGKGLTHIEATVTRGADFVRFAIADDGCGMAKEQLPRLFEGTLLPGDTAVDAQKRSMGIGLSVCRSIIRAHGGALEAASRPGGGVIFWFTMPLEEGTYGESTQDSAR